MHCFDDFFVLVFLNNWADDNEFNFKVKKHPQNIDDYKFAKEMPAL